ncbi:MAG: hypothetical protein ACHQ53_16355, partial [Polyangiales bacterium]
GVMSALAVLCALGCASSSSSGGGGTVQFTASGEVLALGGYDFPADPDFVDGWQIRFDELLVTLDDITLSENPDKSPSDQSKTDKAVARVKGPWAIDLHKGGPLQGKGGSDEQAVAIAKIEDQNLNGGAPFDDTRRYAFGFDVVAASDSAKQVNLDDTAKQDYATMVQNGWAVLYVGTATFEGTDCTSTDPSYDFGKLPKTVTFRLGFKSPTTYVNCQNPDNDPAKPLGDDEHERGVQIKANATTIAQATIHTDHPFWESTVHDSPAHFDALAAHAKDVGGAPTVTLDDLQGVDFTAFTDADGKPLPWRSCDPAYTPPDMAKEMHYDTQGIPHDPSGDPSKVLRDLVDYMTYNQSTQGHLNSDGLCFVKRNYPSPP